MSDDVILLAPANSSPFERNGTLYEPDEDGYVIVPSVLVGDLFSHGFTIPVDSTPNGAMSDDSAMTSAIITAMLRPDLRAYCKVHSKTFGPNTSIETMRATALEVLASLSSPPAPATPTVEAMPSAAEHPAVAAIEPTIPAASI